MRRPKSGIAPTLSSLNFVRAFLSGGGKQAVTKVGWLEKWLKNIAVDPTLFFEIFNFSCSR